MKFGKIILSAAILSTLLTFNARTLPLESHAAEPLRNPFPSPEQVFEKSREGIHFRNPCRRGRTVTITAVGDVLLHDAPQIQAIHDPDRFKSLWKEVEDLLSRADITYANLEGPTAPGIDRKDREVPDPGFIFDDITYSGLPRLNYHPFLLADLRESGFDIVSTANNHAMDRGVPGIERTVDELRAAGLPFSGTRKATDTERDWFTVTEANGIKVAWISCTRRINRDAPYPRKQILHCHRDIEQIEKLIARVISRKRADAVIVTPHWGGQFVHVPKARQIEIGRRFLEAGALAVLGSHPHAIQPWEKVITRDGRETFVFYSLGNFVSGHRQHQRRATVILNLGITKSANGQVTLNGANYIPLLMTRRNSNGERYLTVQALERHPDRSTSKEVRQTRELLAGILGTSNVGPVGGPLVTNPECR